MFNEALIRLENEVVSMVGKNLIAFGMPAPLRHGNNNLTNELLRETSYEIPQLRKFIDLNKPLLDQDQKHVYQTIMSMVDNDEGGILH